MRKVLLLAVITIAPWAQAQQLDLVWGIGVEQDPNERYIKSVLRDPYHVIHCEPKPRGTHKACGKVEWPDQDMAPVGAVHHVDVDHQITLTGPGGSFRFDPIVRCVVYDPETRRRQATGPPLSVCQSVREARHHRLEWAIGGTPQGNEDMPPGMYRGTIMLHVEVDDRRLARAVPVSWEIKEKLRECGANLVGGGSMDLGSVPTGLGGTVTLDPTKDPASSVGGSIATEMAAVSETPGGSASNEFRITPTDGTEWGELRVDISGPTGNLSDGTNTVSFAGSAWYKIDSGDWEDCGSGCSVTPDDDALQLYVVAGGTADVDAGDPAGTYSTTWSVVLLCI